MAASPPGMRCRRGPTDGPTRQQQTKTKPALSLRRRSIDFVVEITGLDGRVDYRGYKSGRHAKNLYFRVLSVVLQESVIQDCNNDWIRIARCQLFGVVCNNLAEAVEDITEHEGIRLLLNSDDPCRGEMVALPRLFLRLN